MFHVLKKSHYDILGVSPRASKKQITTAYRKLALKYHPDRVVGGETAKAAATSKFTEISEAYRTLNDDRRRWEYDNIHGISAKSAADQHHHHQLFSKVEKFFAQHHIKGDLKTKQQHNFQWQGRKSPFSFAIGTMVEPHGMRRTVSNNTTKASKIYNGKRASENKGSSPERKRSSPGTGISTKHLHSSNISFLFPCRHEKVAQHDISTRHLQGSSIFCNGVFTDMQVKVVECLNHCRGVADPLLCGSVPCLAAVK
jgi:DnaJ-class molecular chaperone